MVPEAKVSAHSHPGPQSAMAMAAPSFFPRPVTATVTSLEGGGWVEVGFVPQCYWNCVV